MELKDDPISIPWHNKPEHAGMGRQALVDYLCHKMKDPRGSVPRAVFKAALFYAIEGRELNVIGAKQPPNPSGFEK